MSWNGPIRFFRPHYPVAEWTGLEDFDIAAVWQPRYGTGTFQSDQEGCRGIVAATKPGPGNWRYEVDLNPMLRNEKLSGASYFRVPRGQPKNKEVPWLETQGILGLVTGGGEWLSSRAERGWVTQQVAAALGGNSHRRTRRAIISEDEGILVAQAPGDSQMPDMIELNGTEYEATHSGSAIYRSAGGVMLNMTNDGQ